MGCSDVAGGSPVLARCGIGLVRAKTHITPGLPIFRTPEPPTRNNLMVTYDNSCENSQDSVRTTRTGSSRASPLSWATLMTPVDVAVHCKVAYTSRGVLALLDANLLGIVQF